MQTLTLKIIVEYRSDADITKADKSKLERRFQEMLLSVGKEELFETSATYAGYNAAIDSDGVKNFKDIDDVVIQETMTKVEYDQLYFHVPEVKGMERKHGKV